MCIANVNESNYFIGALTYVIVHKIMLCFFAHECEAQD